MYVQNEVPFSPPSIPWTETFTGDNGDPPDPDMWEIVDGSPEIQSNALQMETTYERVKLKYNLSGDFDIRAPFSGAYHNINSWGYTLMAWSDSDNYIAEARHYNSSTSRWASDLMEGGSYSWDGDVIGGVTTGTLRLTRVGSTVTSYYFSSGWVQQLSGNIGTNEVIVSLVVNRWGSYSGSHNNNWDNFIVNTGTWVV